MIVFTTDYNNAKVALAADGLTNVIVGVYCILRGVDEATGLYESVGKNFALNPPDPNDFTPFDQITKEQLDSWITPTEQFQKMQEVITQSIQNRINTNYVDLPLPFNPPSDTVVMKRMPDINRVQFMFMVRKLGLENTIPTILANLPESTPEEANTKLLANTLWTDGQIFERDHPMFALLAPLVGMTNEQLDEIWLQATQV